jgi:hypothetical protein
MAIWQYDLFLISKEGALPLLAPHGWELPQLPSTSTVRARQTLIATMGHPWLMMENWLVFGTKDSTRVDLLFDGADNVEIRIRLGASATASELNAVCCFVRELNCGLFDPATRSLLQPDHNLLASALAASRAAEFAEGPRAFLSS